MWHIVTHCSFTVEGEPLSAWFTDERREYTIPFSSLSLPTRCQLSRGLLQSLATNKVISEGVINSFRYGLSATSPQTSQINIALPLPRNDNPNVQSVNNLNMTGC